MFLFQVRQIPRVLFGNLKSVVSNGCDKVFRHCSAVMRWSCSHDQVIHEARVGERGNAKAVYVSPVVLCRAKKTSLISKLCYVDVKRPGAKTVEKHIRRVGNIPECH